MDDKDLKTRLEGLFSDMPAAPRAEAEPPEPTAVSQIAPQAATPSVAAPAPEPAPAAAVSESGLKTILDSMLSGVIVIDAATHRIVDANPAAVRLWGGPKEQMVGRVCHEVVCPAQAGQCPITDCGQAVDNSERVMINAIGQRIPILKTVTQVTLQGRLHLVESLLDLFSLRRSEQSLTDERAMLRKLIDTIPDYIYVKDTQSRMLLANVGQARLLGVISPEDLVGKTDFDFFSRELAQKFYDDEQAIIRTGEPLIGQEEPAVDAAGHPKWTLTTKVPFRDQTGQVVGIMGVGRDITDLKQAQDEHENLLREIRANAEHQQKISTVLARVRSAQTLDQVMNAAVQQIGSVLGAARVAVRLDPGDAIRQSDGPAPLT